MSTTRENLDLAAAVTRRRTFAIISHPDAGKTTLTEKLLLYGGAIRLAGAVKGRRTQRHATSDWMELERQRGISITSSVLQFEYGGHQLNILDTPGHQDFSEDTYRTLTAADAAIMLIDAAKGVEPQTIKLFEVCRLRGIPIFTFVNKLDRHGKDPFSLMAEIEAVLGIRSYPMNWPVGMGRDFRGVYNRDTEQVEWFEAAGRHGETVVDSRFCALSDPNLPALLGPDLEAQLREEIELLAVAGDPMDTDRVRRGLLTPMFFGSALNGFGVRAFLEAFLRLAPPPGPRPTDGGAIDPRDPRFSGFVFKIQANMNPAHRDRIAFIRICSGRFERGMTVWHTRLGKAVRLTQPQQFMAQDRQMVEEAWPGDVIGIFDPGIFRIGDTLCEGEAFAFAGIPTFSPEHFAVLRARDTMKQKQFKKGLDQLSEEGAIQVFTPAAGQGKDPIAGAVGELQFEVLIHRLQHEYSVAVQLERLPYVHARWIAGPGADPQRFLKLDSTCVFDRDGRPVALFRTDWALRMARENHSDVEFLNTAPGA